MLEESNLARWISQLLKPHVQQIVVCDARRNRLISQDHHKHDQPSHDSLNAVCRTTFERSSCAANTFSLWLRY
jgi:hypothetical protein